VARVVGQVDLGAVRHVAASRAAVRLALELDLERDRLVQGHAGIFERHLVFAVVVERGRAVTHLEWLLTTISAAAAEIGAICRAFADLLGDVLAVVVHAMVVGFAADWPRIGRTDRRRAGAAVVAAIVVITRATATEQQERAGSGSEQARDGTSMVGAEGRGKHRC